MESRQTPPSQTPQANAAQSPPQPTVQVHVQQPAVVTVPARPTRSMVRMFLTLAIDVLFIIALALLVRIVMSFFEPLAATPFYKPLAATTRPLVLPLGIGGIKTPFKGVFEVNAAVTIVAILVVEYLLGTVRRNT